MLSARRIGEDAEKAILLLPVARGDTFYSLYSYLTVDEPAVHLIPLHFLPQASSGRIGESSLHELAVAAKVEYARNRWLDELVDHPDRAPDLPSTHQLDEALVALIYSRYASVLDASAAAAFFPVLSNLYARHGLSLILDSTRYRNPAASLSLEGYAEHAKTRHGPVRAPVDALLFLVGAAESLLEQARASWHQWALGVQFYDDALDIEEDYRDRNLSWAVARALRYFDGCSDGFATGGMPGPDAFYEKALREGVISETLGQAEAFFAESARLAGEIFPSWAIYQHACVSQARRLREDYEKLLAGA